MKTQTCLYVREDGKILIFDKPAHFYSDHPDEDKSQQYQSALKEAIDKAVEVADQEEAEGLIYESLGYPKSINLLPESIYPIPGITYEVREEECVMAICNHRKCNKCGSTNDEDCKLEPLAYITPVEPVIKLNTTIDHSIGSTTKAIIGTAPVVEEEETVPFDFVVWYSGMKPEQVKRQIERWETEVKKV